MKKMVVTVTEAARNFADCVNRAHYQRTTFVLLKNGKPFARLEPDDEKRCRGRQLADVLARVELTPAQAQEWQWDLRRARKALKPPANKWQ